MILVFAITIGLQFTNNSTALAKNIYLGSKGEVDYYFDTEKNDIDVNEHGAGIYSIVCSFGVVQHFPRGDEYIRNAGYAYFDNIAGYWRSDGTPMDRWNIIQTNTFNIIYPRIGTELEKKRRKAEEERRKEEEERIALINKFNSLIEEGDRYYNAKDYENAEKAYDQARRIDYEELDKLRKELIKNGDNLVNQKLFDAALDYYKKAQVMGDYDVREKILNIQKLKKDNAIAESNAAYFSFNELEKEGDRFYENKQYKKAIESYNKALSINTSHVNNIKHIIYKKLGNAYEEIGEYGKALEYYNKRGISIDIAKLYRRIKNYDKAIEYYKKANPYSYELLEFGSVYIEAKKYNELIEYYNQNKFVNEYINIKDKHDDKYRRKIYFQLGYAHRELKDYENAINEFNQAIKLNKKVKDLEKDEKLTNLADEVIYYNLGLTYECIGKNKKAIEAYNQALEINPKYKEASEALSKLSTKTK